MTITSPFLKEVFRKKEERRAMHAPRAAVLRAAAPQSASITHTASKDVGGRMMTVKLPIGTSGVPEQAVLENLAREHDITAYTSSFIVRVLDCHRQGLRGSALAAATLESIVALQSTQKRRCNGSTDS